MKKIKFLYPSLLLLMMSCSSEDDLKIIHYEYHGVVITRVNDYPKDFFYYGRFNDLDNLPKEYILSQFSGIDGLMDAYLIFRKDKTVEVRKIADDFTKIGTTSNLYLNENIENIDFIHWSDSTRNNLDNIVRVSDVIESEREINKAGNSKVRVYYDVLRTR